MYSAANRPPRQLPSVELSVSAQPLYVSFLPDIRPPAPPDPVDGRELEAKLGRGGAIGKIDYVPTIRERLTDKWMFVCPKFLGCLF